MASGSWLLVSSNYRQKFDIVSARQFSAVTMGVTYSSLSVVPTGRYWVGTPIRTAIRGMRMHHPGQLIKVASLEDMPALIRESVYHPAAITIIYNSYTEKTIAVVRM
jgi:hypothetical protein